MLKLASIYNVNIHWLLTGIGKMFIPDNSIETPTPEIIEIENKNGIVNMNRDGVIKMGNASMRTTAPAGEKSESLLVVSPEEVLPPDHRVRVMTVFEIPLLTREQVLQFDSGKEIPVPKAYSGEYPDYMLVPMPKRFMEYSTDLRVIVVFNSLMSPLLNPGEVAIFQATGWNGDGVYVYRMKGDLYMSHVKSSSTAYRLTKEFRGDEEIPWDGGTFEVIGRVRAVVREIT
jgi:hypothetical protein